MDNALQRPTTANWIQSWASHMGRANLVLLAVASLLPSQAKSETLHLVEIFTAVSHPIQEFRRPVPGLSKVHVYRIDRLHRLESRLSEDLPSDPELARQQALDRLQKIPETDRARLQQAAVGLARAAHYGIDRYPAMVFNGHAVVYGLTDLKAALTHYRHWYRR